MLDLAMYQKILFGLFCAVLGGFLTKLMERLAILRTLRRETETIESIRQMIAQRNAAITNLYAKLILALGEYRDFLSPSKGLSEPEDQMVNAARTFTEFYEQAAIWLPESVEKKVEWLADALHKIYLHTVRWRPSEAEADGSELKNAYYAQKTKARERLAKDGDITVAVHELKSMLRQVLEGRELGK